jgi:hypothetical protein
MLTNVLETYVIPLALHVLLAALIWLIGRWLARRSRDWLDKSLQKTALTESFVTLINTVSYAGILILAGLLALAVLGVPVTAITATLGVVVVVISIAMQQSLANLAATITILLFRPFKLVIVSNWARTGWNVIRPNVLIDATATRDLTAWTQLRGRAIRALRSWTNDCYRLLVVLDGHDYLESEGDDPDAEPEPEQTERSQAQLYSDLLALFSTVASEEMVERVDTHYSEYGSAVDALTAEERDEMAVRLVRAHNKVTHIYEMVKAYGSGSQVTFDRSRRAWVRREAIAAKHWQEIATNPFTGEKLAGPGHAPLVYAEDPRNDLPTALQEHLAQAIADSDEIIVQGWMGAEADS